MEIAIPTTLEEFNAAGAEYLPGHLGLTFLKVEPDEVIAEVEIRKAIRSWNPRQSPSAAMRASIN